MKLSILYICIFATILVDVNSQQTTSSSQQHPQCRIIDAVISYLNTQGARFGCSSSGSANSQTGSGATTPIGGMTMTTRSVITNPTSGIGSTRAPLSASDATTQFVRYTTPFSTLGTDRTTPIQIQTTARAAT